MGTLAAGIKEIFATAKTTGSNVMLCGNDGTPDGHMTMANLASVLGATTAIQVDKHFKSFGNLTDVDADTLPNGFGYVYAANYETYHLPESFCIIVNFTERDDNPRTGDAFQICYGAGARKFYFRCHQSSSWSSWQEFSFNIPLFYKDYSTLASLASALGVYTCYTRRYEAGEYSAALGAGWRIAFTNSIDLYIDIDNKLFYVFGNFPTMSVQLT